MPDKRIRKPIPKPIEEKEESLFEDAENPNDKIRKIEENAAEQEEVKWLRRLAGTKYITSQDPITVLKLSEDPEFKNKVSIRSLNRWCANDNWVEERRKYFDRLEAGIRRQIEKKAIKATIDQLQEYDQRINKLVEKIDTEAEPGTYEGLLSVYVKMVKEREILREKVIKDVVPEGFAEMGLPNSPQLVPSFDLAEAREAALFLIRRRQKLAKQKMLEAKQEATKNGETLEQKS